MCDCACVYTHFLCVCFAEPSLKKFFFKCSKSLWHSEPRLCAGEVARVGRGSRRKGQVEGGRKRAEWVGGLGWAGGLGGAAPRLGEAALTWGP